MGGGGTLMSCSPSLIAILSLIAVPNLLISQTQLSSARCLMATSKQTTQSAADDTRCMCDCFNPGNCRRLFTMHRCSSTTWAETTAASWSSWATGTPGTATALAFRNHRRGWSKLTRYCWRCKMLVGELSCRHHSQLC